MRSYHGQRFLDLHWHTNSIIYTIIRTLCSRLPAFSVVERGFTCFPICGQSPARLRCNSPLDCGNTIHEFCSEKNVGIIKHALFQWNNNELQGPQYMKICLGFIYFYTSIIHSKVGQHNMHPKPIVITYNLTRLCIRYSLLKTTTHSLPDIHVDIVS